MVKTRFWTSDTGFNAQSLCALLCELGDKQTFVRHFYHVLCQQMCMYHSRRQLVVSHRPTHLWYVSLSCVTSFSQMSSIWRV
jgi:hypothetical protein